MIPTTIYQSAANQAALQCERKRQRERERIHPGFLPIAIPEKGDFWVRKVYGIPSLLDSKMFFEIRLKTAKKRVFFLFLFQPHTYSLFSLTLKIKPKLKKK